ncbi:Leucine Rich Repeat family protein [Trichomonas vaginalis G3]|uniref:Leucine Rich Repeat family protein n=1 Tax=Trichomonas vaginalis (strain ATCC PRA-98 / G3) TaxID=412133 RepID=A2FR20_TRIV3|nr:uncharacterized protein TVAGG3_0415930 [Trichomonas vaginalis G3]EAX92650.1 Leucine Rich Repeat family protein [Trichomonas vaginalis G3]KAI5535700.1 DNA damage response, detection of DNA damage [Trichomonas vaginalis G3]|eukprot:XP_001305580.1 hypothetical protein [Trichomonas vaginalis G3]
MLSDSQNVTLTDGMVMRATKSNNIEEVEKVYFYHENLSDIAIVEYMINLEIAYFTGNKIRTLKPFAKCQKLRELYIRYNQISSFEELNYLKELKNLKVLWMMNNPVSEQPNYREFIIKSLPQLTKLDDIEISDAERRFVALTKSNSYKDSRNAFAPGDKLARTPKSFADAPEFDSKLVQQPPAPTPSQPSQNTHEHRRVPSSLASKKQSVAKYHTPHSRSSLSDSAQEDDKNLLTAVLTLLPELSVDSLEIVLHKIRELTQ